ncbi:FeoA family protein [Pseudalkalibacillus caeni]|uniref:Ferrous iron transport protein A n=1 Tax=Exobacillus caeni TaxID=2574798 RepID=A0A5R9F009_9BACL|nr:FeoA family protein [Pseudalkalibacillus caeni]TLS36932.1 ferrous iron transport protein A [Pseudalkalibacillus caeni]
MVLTELSRGELAKITDFSTVNELVQRRLIHLGMKENTEVCIKRKLPFGGPCMIEACGQGISIRLNEAKNIRIEKL